MFGNSEDNEGQPSKLPWANMNSASFGLESAG